MTGTPKSVFIAKVRELLQRCKFWRQWQWYQIHEARVRLREAELAITCFDDYDPKDLDARHFAIPRISESRRNAGTQVRDQGVVGNQLMDLIDKANDVGEVEAGKRVADLMEAGLGKLSREENFLVHNVLQGDTDKVVDLPEAEQDRIFGMATIIRAILDSMGQANVEAKTRVAFSRYIYPGDRIPDGVTLTPEQEERLSHGRHVLISGKHDFFPRSYYYPHVIKDVSLMKPAVFGTNKLREDILRNIVEQGHAADHEEAASLLDAYIRFIDNGGREKTLIQHLINSGQANNAAEARVKLARFRQRTIKRSGSMEHAREINLPFYDPSPARVLPTWIAQNSIRLKQIELFGQDNEVVNRLISRVRVSAATVYAKCDDDLSILLQRRLIRSAHRWRIRVPSASDRTLWDKFPYRTNDRRLKPNAVHEIQETLIQRRVTAFGLIFGLSSIIQTVFAALTYFRVFQHFAPRD